MYYVEGKAVDVWADNEGGLWYYDDRYRVVHLDEDGTKERSSKMCPFKGKPDCFNCPLPDCEAKSKDIVRQIGLERMEQRKARDKVIVDEFLKGADINGLAERFGFKDESNVCRILKKEGIDYKKIRKERRRCWR